MSTSDDDQKKFRPKSPYADSDLDREIEEALGEASLDDLLAVEEAAERGKAPTRTGRVIAIQGEDIFVELGGKSQGVIPLSQFPPDEEPAEGDLIEVVINGTDESEGLMLLSRPGAPTEASWDTLQQGQLVEGRVTGHNKGGLELEVNGIRAFMPISQIERFRVEELAPYENRRMKCKVVEVDRMNRNLVVSQRAIQEEDAAEARQRMFDELKEGQIVRGVVRSVMPYGAFVDIGGVDGLLHISDMSYARIEDPHTIVQEGQDIDVKVLKIDRDERKIGLGLKQVLPDPWTGAEHKWPVGSMATGRVTRLADFGAFVELAPGVEGLAPIGELSLRRIRHPSDVVKTGDVVKVSVMSVDLERKRISLSLKRTQDDPWTGASVRWPAGSVVEGVVTRIADFGAFVELTEGVEGMVHISELSAGHVKAVRDAVEEGQAVQVKVLTVEEDRRRIGLSIKQAAASTESGPSGLDKHLPPTDKKRTRPLKGGLD